MRRAVKLALIAAAAAAVGVSMTCGRQAIVWLFGPPRVSMREAYGGGGGGAFDHSEWDALLRAHVREGGFVDYDAMDRDRARLDRYLDWVAEASFADLSRDEKLAFLINAYNAATVQLILDHRPVASIRDIPASERWDAPRVRIDGRLLSLNQIEHQEIRPKFAEPRVHFALVCAARGCPPLRSEAYTGPKLDAQLEDQARRVHGSDRWLRLSEDRRVVELTPLYEWYRGDFLQFAPSVEEFAARYSEPLREALASGPVEVRFLAYDWSLNDVRE